jgi:long-chain acyl-CoA synthetase
VSFTTLIEAFRHQVTARPNAIALIVESSDGTTQSLSWKQLAGLVSRAAAVLSDRLESSSAARRIGHASDNSLADIVIALASMRIGAIEVPIDHRLGQREIVRRWNRVGGLWLDRKSRWQLMVDSIAEAKTESQSTDLSSFTIDADTPSLILWTSGTTGTNQGVVLSHRNLAGNAAAKLRAVPQSPQDVRLCVLPLSHAYARTCDLGTWLLSGCTLAATLGYAGLRRLAPVVLPTLINTVPILAYRLLEESPRLAGLDQLRLLGCGGAAISASAFGRWKDRGVTVIQGYGLTETSPVICSATPENALPGLVGRLVDGWESDIREGQLFVRGPHTMLGYWDNNRATSRKVDREGWLATGDLVEQEPSTGQFAILGRVDEVIVLDSAKKIFPSTIEREVETIAGVRHALLVYQDSLQLWFDADQESEQVIKQAISKLLREHADCRDCSLHRFPTPLSQAAGELTAKGTIRRAQILENRFA